MCFPILLTGENTLGWTLKFGIGAKQRVAGSQEGNNFLQKLRPVLNSTDQNT